MNVHLFNLYINVCDVVTCTAEKSDFTVQNEMQ